ncbi:MAG TPA: hypothetical protein VJ600_07810 [Holophagaceae bacterium]|nr:hypothetical protein [Holophagaceae bacterium]
MPIPLLIPALLLLAAPGVPDALELTPGVYVLEGAPTAATYASLRSAKISYVINLRRDGEPGFDPGEESAALGALGVNYIRLAIGKAPARADLDLFRSILRDLPKNARILVHCGDGNRASAAVCAFLVLDRGMKADTALAEARTSGLRLPETERALRRYLGQEGGV